MLAHRKVNVHLCMAVYLYPIKVNLRNDFSRKARVMQSLHFPFEYFSVMQQNKKHLIATWSSNHSSGKIESVSPSFIWNLACSAPQFTVLLTVLREDVYHIFVQPVVDASREGRENPLPVIVAETMPFVGNSY